jgi:hypothetical protein
VLGVGKHLSIPLLWLTTCFISVIQMMILVRTYRVTLTLDASWKMVHQCVSAFQDIMVMARTAKVFVNLTICPSSNLCNSGSILASTSSFGRL